jgi:hypothetical protein
MATDNGFDVQPLVNTHNSLDNRYDFLGEPLPRPPFRLIVVGNSGSGKTLLDLNLITRWLVTPEGKSIFKKIFIFTPSLLIDPSFRYLANHPEFGNPNLVYASNQLDLNIIEELINREYDDSDILIYIDDFASSKRALQDKILYDLYFRSRHNNISLIFNTQYYKQVPIACRLNANYVALFALTGDKEIQLVKEELSTPKFHDKTFDEAMKVALDGDSHNFLFINKGTGKFYKCMKKEITIE